MEPESRDHLRHGAALRETAKLAASVPAAPKPPPRRATADSSGFVDLSALMAEQPNWLDNALSRAKAASAGSLPPTTFTPGSLAPPALFGGSIAPTLRGLDDEIALGVPRGRPVALLVASSIAGLLITTACIFAIRSSHHPAAQAAPPAHTAQAVAAVQAPPAAQDDAPLIPPPPAATDTAGAAGTNEGAAADSDSTPARAAENDTAPAAHHGRHGHHALASAAPADVPVPAAAPARPTGGVSGPRSGSALDNALRAAAGPAGAAPAVAAPAAPALAAPKAAPPPAADNRPERPSGSAVTSALTEALPAARRCVAQMSDASRALVSFGSDGAVHRVDVSGPAAGNPKATQCLRAAFGRARVPAFSQATYAAGVTVRPQ